MIYSREDIEGFVTRQGAPAGVARVVAALALTETAGNPDAVGALGERGLWQVRPDTWQRIVRGSAPASASLADQWAWASPVLMDVGGSVARFSGQHYPLGAQDAARVLNLAWQWGWPRVEAWLLTRPPRIAAAAFGAWVGAGQKAIAALVQREIRFLALVGGAGLGFVAFVFFLAIGLVLALRKL